MTTETRPALRYDGYVDGIDISEAQIVTDAQAVADDGFVFAAIKTAEGLNYCDARALENLTRLRDVGILCNVYTFLRPSQGDPAKQIAKVFSCAGPEFPYRVLLDGEGAPDGMPADEIVSFYEGCADACLTYGVLEPDFYSFPSYIQTRLMPALGRSKRLGRCGFHIAHYGAEGAWLPPRGWKPFLCAPWNRWTKHQYSGNGGYRVRGIAGDCDRDLYNGDIASFRAYMGLPGAGGDASTVVHPDEDLTPPEPREV